MNSNYPGTGALVRNATWDCWSGEHTRLASRASVRASSPEPSDADTARWV